MWTAVLIASCCAPGIDFDTEVLPVLTRAGCNTGKCHGAASGKDGFRLSLFGYDPEGDYYRLMREMSGRRMNLAAPAECLLIQKATGEVAHTGGQRILPESPHYRTLMAWLPARTLMLPEPVETSSVIEPAPPIVYPSAWLNEIPPMTVL